MSKNRKTAGVAAKPATASSRLQSMLGSATGTVDRSEGHSVPVQRFTQAGLQRRWGIDVSKAPVPQRRYAAEICDIVRNDLEVRIIFGQRSLFGDDLDTALVIRMTPKATVEFIESMHEMDIASMKGELNLPVENLTPITSKPLQTANVVSNLVSVGVADHETCLDFYHASAFALGKATKQSHLEIEPVVRVDLRTSLFVPLVSRLSKIVTEF
jgi:hypothetical protein